MKNTTLHIVSRSPHNHSALEDCSLILAEDDALILIGDGVYAATNPQVDCFVLEEDLVQRGLDKAQLPDSATVVDYSGFVALCVQHPLTQSWY